LLVKVVDFHLEAAQKINLFGGVCGISKKYGVIYQ